MDEDNERPKFPNRAQLIFQFSSQVRMYKIVMVRHWLNVESSYIRLTIFFYFSSSSQRMDRTISEAEIIELCKRKCRVEIFRSNLCHKFEIYYAMHYYDRPFEHLEAHEKNLIRMQMLKFWPQFEKDHMNHTRYLRRQQDRRRLERNEFLERRHLLRIQKKMELLKDVPDDQAEFCMPEIRDNASMDDTLIEPSASQFVGLCTRDIPQANETEDGSQEEPLEEIWREDIPQEIPQEIPQSTPETESEEMATGALVMDWEQDTEQESEAEADHDNSDEDFFSRTVIHTLESETNGIESRFIVNTSSEPLPQTPDVLGSLRSPVEEICFGESQDIRVSQQKDAIGSQDKQAQEKESEDTNYETFSNNEQMVQFVSSTQQDTWIELKQRTSLTQGNENWHRNNIGITQLDRSSYSQSLWAYLLNFYFCHNMFVLYVHC